MRNLRVEFLSEFEVEVSHLSGVELSQEVGQERYHFFLFGNEVFVNGVGDCTDSVFVMALVFEEEAVE